MLGKTHCYNVHNGLDYSHYSMLYIESCTSQPCNQLQFNCIEMNHKDPSPVIRTTASTVYQVIYPTTTMDTAAVMITETIAIDTLTLTTTVISIETSTLLPAYITTTVPYIDHGRSEGAPTILIHDIDLIVCLLSNIAIGDTMKGTTREKILGVLLGVFVVLFVSVAVGWVWSCWTSKRRAIETAQAQ